MTGFRLEAISAPGPGTVTLDGKPMETITQAAKAARPGSKIDLGRGRFGAETESFPIELRDGVTLRGPTPPDVPREARKHLPAPESARLIGEGPLVAIVGNNVTIAHCTIENTLNLGAAIQTVGSLVGLTIDTCMFTGTVVLDQASGVTIQWSNVAAGNVVARSCSDLNVTGGQITPRITETGMTIVNCRNVRIEAVAVTNCNVAVDSTSVSDLHIGGCALIANEIGVRVDKGSDISVRGNRLRGEKAIWLTNCANGAIEANGVEWADTAFRLEASGDIRVDNNHIAQARVAVAEG